MKQIAITEDTSVNWFLDYGVLAINTQTGMVEVGCDFCKDDNIVINIADFLETDEETISVNMVQARIISNVAYLLYAHNMRLVGFVTEN